MINGHLLYQLSYSRNKNVPEGGSRTLVSRVTVWRSAIDLPLGRKKPVASGFGLLFTFLPGTAKAPHGGAFSLHSAFKPEPSKLLRVMLML